MWHLGYFCINLHFTPIKRKVKQGFSGATVYHGGMKHFHLPQLQESDNNPVQFLREWADIKNVLSLPLSLCLFHLLVMEITFLTYFKCIFEISSLFSAGMFSSFIV